MKVTTRTKSEQNKIKMKTLKNNSKNQQKQKQTNILESFNGLELYKQQKNDVLLKQSHHHNNRQSPVSMKSYRQLSDQKTRLQSFTERHTYVALKNQDSQDPHFSGSNTLRQCFKEGQGNVNLEDISENKGINMVKKQIGSGQKKRFYYKEEYDTILDEQQQFAKGKFSEISQSKTILPDYFAKLNSRTPKIDEFDSSSAVSSQRQKRSLSPLEESQQQLFAKCYKQTSHHLKLMLKEIHQSQDNLAVIHQEVLDTISHAVKERASFIRSQMLEMVEDILNDWEASEWMFIEKNQILFIDDVLELKEQLNERELKVNLLIQKLQKQKKQSWIIGDKRLNQNFKGEISKTQSIWKNVTTDLLMFNYEDSIMEIQQLSGKISSSIPQKCRKAIEVLPSSHFRLTNGNKSVSSDALQQLKTSIMKNISEILHNCRNSPESRTYSQMAQFSKRNPKKNLRF